ncbi:hypothetical protein FRC01_004765 [Tulasnella sp. 417]|nr:hypothetical protein FRC01_004765 [Tulasnella sp. 417]
MSSAMARTTLVLATLLAVYLNFATAFRLRVRDHGGGQSPLQIPVRNVNNQMYTVHIEMNTTLQIAGRTVQGQLAKENCGFKQQDDEWWRYKNQSLIIASTGTDSSAFGGSGGIAGFGQSNAQDPKDTLISQYLTSNQTTLSQFVFGFALSDQSDTKAANGVELQGDASGGFMHLDQPDPAFFTGSIQTFPVAGSEISTPWGSVPGQLGSFDWTVQTQGWLVKTAAGDVTGSQGMYGTLEASYPYLLLPQRDANKLYAAIPGSVPYILPTNAADARGVPIYQDSLSLSWSVPCNTTLDTSFFLNFQGVSVPLLPSDFMTQVGGVCVGNVKGWADSTRQTGILGNAFFRNAYVVFTASTDPSTNTVGLANRPLIDGQSKDNATKGIVIGAVVGGLVFLICVGLAVFFVARHWKTRRRSPPSAIFAGAVSGGSIDDNYTSEKRHSVRNTTSSFLGLGSPTRGSAGHQNYVAEPWVPPPSSTPGLSGGGSERGVVVAPWTPQVPSEQAFLSPTGHALDTTVVAMPYTSSSQHSHTPLPTVPATPMSGGAPSPAPTGYRNPSPQRPMSGQSYASYAPLPTESPRPRPGSVASSNPTSPTPLLSSQQQFASGPGSAPQYHGGPPSSQYGAGGVVPQQYSSASRYSATSPVSQYGATSPPPQYQPSQQIQSLPPGARPRSLPPPPHGQGGQPF